MTKASIVIGCGWGDEGKGRTTDYLCSLPSLTHELQNEVEKKIVIRFSGGQQAGHNVKINDLSHIHSNFGSGTLRGVPSFFSEHCTIYPVTMFREQQVLNSKGITPKLYIHPLAKVTTPFDVAYNRIIELKKGHGSCGLGISATMKRNLETGHKLYAIDLFNQSLLNAKLINIQKYYYNLIDNETDLCIFRDFELGDIDDFFVSLEKLKFETRNYEFIKENYDNLIFEGSQGILLDMDHGIFPNVTFANTTSKNALEICNKLGISKENIQIYYITRCYQTRHGTGWMSNQEKIKLINTEDEINVYNEWQQNFKIGELDYNLLNYALDVDMIYSEGLRRHLVVTCLDQRPGFEFNSKKLKYGFKTIFGTYSPDNSKLMHPMEFFI
jgi:adenylosuccinate synthase